MRQISCGVSHAAVIFIVGALLSSCAFVDAFGPRVYQNNLTFQDANSQEALLNIIRASRYEALSFVAIGQETGSQTESLGTGLPTFTLGAAQTATQKQFAFGGNSLSSSAIGGFQVNPLVSSNFMQGMLTPIDTKTLALLIGTYPREWVFNAVLEGVRLSGYLKANPKVRLDYYFRNDPGDDQYDGVIVNDRCKKLLGEAHYGDSFYADDTLCNYSKFSDFLGEAVQYGLTSEILPPSSGADSSKNQNQCCCCGTPSATSKNQSSPTINNAGTNSISAPQTPSATSNATATPASIGHLCWDPVLALQKHRQVVRQMQNVCGVAAKASSKFEFIFSEAVFDDVKFIFRSPYGVYKFLGQLLRERSAQYVQFYNVRTREERELESGLFLNITEGASDCLVSAFYNGHSYCVPRVGSNSTGIMLDILGQLKNLSTSPSDLNAAFAVRVID